MVAAGEVMVELHSGDLDSVAGNQDEMGRVVEVRSPVPPAGVAAIQSAIAYSCRA
jgi:hypothetical protein